MISSHSKSPGLTAMLLLGLLLAACQVASSAATPPASTAVATDEAAAAADTPTLAPSAPPRPEHRIGVRVVDGVGEFYDRETGEKYVPRGNNYIRTARQDTSSGQIFYHSTFNVGLYDAAEADANLAVMHEAGYNVVRVFVNGCCDLHSIGDPAGGLRPEYIANLVDFLRKAQVHGIFVMITGDDLPKAGGYIEIQDTTWQAEFPGSHATYLLPGGIRASRQFWADFIEALIRQDAPFEAIFSFELLNEMHFYSDGMPFTLSSGVLKTANGRSYSMASEADKQLMVEEGSVYWMDKVRERILELDPTALVSVGFFHPQGPNPDRIGDPRLAVTAPAIWDSQLDFVDLHPYPGLALSLAEYVENYGIQRMQEKPIIMGEFGLTITSYPSLDTAAHVLARWQAESCEYGFDGWLFWTWDLASDDIFRRALDGGGAISEILSPAARPDPCQPP